MGQSSSRQQDGTPAAASTHHQPSQRRRRFGPRPSSTVFTSSSRDHDHSVTLDGVENANEAVEAPPSSRARPRSVHLPDLFHRPQTERRQVRSRSPPQRTRHTLRRGPSRNGRNGNLTQRLFHRARGQDESGSRVGQPWSVEPRDSLDMAHAARERDNSQPQLAPIPQEPFSLNLDDHVPSSTPERYTIRSSRDLRPGSSLANRISSLTPARELSRLTATLRRRHGRTLTSGEQNAAMLQRLLSVAAAATAASLMGGNPDDHVNDLRRTAVAVDGDNGAFDNFLQVLRSGQLASRLGRDSNNNNNDAPDDGEANRHDNAGSDSNTNSLQYFRMFRFGPSSSAGSRASMRLRRSANNDTTSQQSSQGVDADANRRESQNTDRESRTVSVLIVGIRSLNQDVNDPAHAEGADAMPSFIDALTSLNASWNIDWQDEGEGAPVGTPRSGHGLSSATRSRRASMGGLFAGRDRTRRARLSNSGRPLSEVGPSVPSTMPDLVESPTITEGLDPHLEQPESPLPFQEPPAPIRAEVEPSPDTDSTAVEQPTNAPVGRSRFREGLRDSWRQSWRESWNSARGSNRRSMIDTPSEEPEAERAQPRWSRRRGYRHALRFGSGAARRNGIVEPDQPSSDGNRSWIIYVLGGSYPEDHPILTTPSLFSDNPTYEDMLRLSSLLGPVKPPVAQPQDVNAAGGLFNIEVADGQLLARAVHEDGDDGFTETIALDRAETCQVCISTYSQDEVARRLKDCKHLFHRECIDEWLTTGRNCCPLCRSRGVFETTPAPNPDIQMPGAPGSSRDAAAAAAREDA